MKRPLAPLAVKLLATLLLLTGVPYAWRWNQKNSERQQVYELLRTQGRAQRFQSLQMLQTLAKEHPGSTVPILLQAFEDPDAHLRVEAARNLALLRLKDSPAVTQALAAHLQTDTAHNVRLACAIGLMRSKSPTTLNAYIHASRDQYPKVAQIACGQLGVIGGPAAKEALFEALSQHNWDVRLEACKALITLKAADSRVVTALKKLSQDPKAAEYDAQIEELEQEKRQFHAQGHADIDWSTWGKIGTILTQAQHLAAQNS